MVSDQINVIMKLICFVKNVSTSRPGGGEVFLIANESACLTKVTESWATRICSQAKAKIVEAFSAVNHVFRISCLTHLVTMPSFTMRDPDHVGSAKLVR